MNIGLKLSMKTNSCTWQIALKQVITDLNSLCEILELDPKLPELSYANSFPLRVPLSFVQKMQKGNSSDPLLLQVLPQKQEFLISPGYSHDPLKEKRFSPLPGLLHKYHGRVLLLLTGSCAVHCRYCFRRHFPYEEHSFDQSKWEQIIHYIASDSSISEVILSGGDPLLVKDKPLRKFLEKLASIKHLTSLRIHSRFPVVIPERLTAELAEILNSTRLKPLLVLHCNHANEIDEVLAKGVMELRKNQIHVLNQTVLLKGINDNSASLISLSQRLFDIGVLPYYLHLLDPVAGAEHFTVSAEQAKKILVEISAKLPGYLVPKLVQEQPGAASKIGV